ncbi:MAG TPA: hypothetical protein VKS21_03260 [Spirochaetota bacterium]|nr:hypothetical protein [Spirochaetota bacterium]
MKIFKILAAVFLLLNLAVYAQDSNTAPAGQGSDTSTDTSSGEQEAGDEAAAEQEDDEGSGVNFGVSVDYVTLDGETYTKIRFFPEIPIGKFAMAFDLALYLDSSGKPIDKGYNFDTAEAGIDTILNKIYYIRFNERDNVVYGEDHFFFKLGNLDNVTLGAGLIMKDYCNTLDYPAEKKTGLHFAVGNLGKMKFGLEYMLNNFSDFSRKGVIMGGRMFLNPFGGASGKINKLQFGVTYVADINQYAALKESDGDRYPDEVDKFPYEKKYHADTDDDGLADAEDLDADGDNLVDYKELSPSNKTNLNNDLETYGYTNTVDFNIELESVYQLDKDQIDTFSLLGLDLIFPFNDSFKMYGQWGVPVDPKQKDYDTNKAKGFGMSFPAIDVRTKVFDMNMEYRFSTGDFVYAYFNKYYDHNRAWLDSTGNNFLTADNNLVGAKKNGVYGAFTIKIPSVFNIVLNYEHLFLKDADQVTLPGETNSFKPSYEAAYTGKLTVNEELLEQVKVIGGFEAYLKNKQIVDYKKQFAKPSQQFVWGFKAALQPGDSISFSYNYQMNYKWDNVKDKFVKDSQMNIGTQAVF